MGNLNSLGNDIEQARSLLHELEQIHANDTRVMSAINSEYSRELIIRLAVTRAEMSRDYEQGGEVRDVILVDFLWAVDFLDHLDTMGLAVCSKNWMKKR